MEWYTISSQTVGQYSPKLVVWSQPNAASLKRGLLPWKRQVFIT
jgi:hypothetical protein